MAMSETKPTHATYDQGGLLRCCAMAIPVDENDKVLAGTEGEHRLCPAAGHKNPDESGVRFVRGVWRAAWIKDEVPPAP
jgi:hypothetical protein